MWTDQWLCTYSVIHNLQNKPQRWAQCFNGFPHKDCSSLQNQVGQIQLFLPIFSLLSLPALFSSLKAGNGHNSRRSYRESRSHWLPQKFSRSKTVLQSFLIKDSSVVLDVHTVCIPFTVLLLYLNLYFQACISQSFFFCSHDCYTLVSPTLKGQSKLLWH